MHSSNAFVWNRPGTLSGFFVARSAVRSDENFQATGAQVALRGAIVAVPYWVGCLLMFLVASALSGFNLSTLTTQLVSKATTQLASSLAQMAPKLLAKFVPGVGIGQALYQGGLGVE